MIAPVCYHRSKCFNINCSSKHGNSHQIQPQNPPRSSTTLFLPLKIKLQNLQQPLLLMICLTSSITPQLESKKTDNFKRCIRSCLVCVMQTFFSLSAVQLVRWRSDKGKLSLRTCRFFGTVKLCLCACWHTNSLEASKNQEIDTECMQRTLVFEMKPYQL